MQTEAHETLTWRSFKVVSSTDTPCQSQMHLLYKMLSLFAADQGLESTGVFSFYCIPSTLTSEDYKDIIPFRTCYEAECWWLELTKVKRERAKPQRQGPRKQTKYEMLCKTAEQGFTDKVQDFGSEIKIQTKSENFLVNCP